MHGSVRTFLIRVDLISFWLNDYGNGLRPDLVFGDASDLLTVVYKLGIQKLTENDLYLFL